MILLLSLQSTTRVKPFITTMPMRLDEGWNQIQFNLGDFTRRAYNTNYIETVRVQIHANCRIRRIYFCDRLYSAKELPQEYMVYVPRPEGGPSAHGGSMEASHHGMAEEEAAEGGGGEGERGDEGMEPLPEDERVHPGDEEYAEEGGGDA